MPRLSDYQCAHRQPQDFIYASLVNSSLSRPSGISWEHFWTINLLVDSSNALFGPASIIAHIEEPSELTMEGSMMYDSTINLGDSQTINLDVVSFRASSGLVSLTAYFREPSPQKLQITTPEPFHIAGKGFRQSVCLLSSSIGYDHKQAGFWWQKRIGALSKLRSSTLFSQF